MAYFEFKEMLYLRWNASTYLQAQLLMRVHHKNLASFLGYCNEVGRTAIIYEYMINGNLEEYLSGILIYSPVHFMLALHSYLINDYIQVNKKLYSILSLSRC